MADSGRRRGAVRTPEKPAPRGAEPEERPLPSAWLVAAVVAAVTGLALLVRWAGIDQEPLHDELYNFLAADAWLERGELSIVPGAEPYTRGRFFTILLTWSMQAFGPTLASARIVSVFAGTAVATGITWWLARNGLVFAALVAGGLVALDPQLMQLSQISRFYPLQQLGFLLGTLAFAALVEARSWSRAGVLGLGACAGLLLALQLQIITVIGVAGLALFALAWPDGHPGRLVRDALRRHPVGTPVATLGSLLMLAGAVWAVGILGGLVDLATYADVWAEGARYNVRYYYAWLHDHYAALVVLFPLLILLSWIRAPRITAISLSVFGVAFVVHSGLAWKTPRYLSYALPFFFVICGIGAVEGARWLKEELPYLVERMALLPHRSRGLAVTLALVVIIFSIFIGNRGIVVAARVVTRDPLTHFPLMGPEDGELSWTLATPTIDSLSVGADVLVSSNPLKAVHFLDRLDYILSLSSLRGQEGEREEFWIDPRFDRPVIISPASLARIRCDADALVLVEDVTFRNGLVFPRATVDYLQLQTERRAMPPRTGIHAFWLDRLPDQDVCGTEAPSTSRPQTSRPQPTLFTSRFGARPRSRSSSRVERPEAGGLPAVLEQQPGVLAEMRLRRCQDLRIPVDFGPKILREEPSRQPQGRAGQDLLDPFQTRHRPESRRDGLVGAEIPRRVPRRAVALNEPERSSDSTLIQEPILEGC